MDSPASEIESNILGANFSRVVQLAEEWLQQLNPSELIQTENKTVHPAQEAYQLGRFLLHRQERMGQLPPGVERARLFMGILTELENGVIEASSPQSTFLASARAYCHSQIAESLARSFAGQKSYNLNQEEILQLSFSLLEIGNIASAEEVLDFLYQLNPRNATVNFLLSYVNDHRHDSKRVKRFLREALFIRPELATELARFLPEGVFRELYSHLQSSDYPEEVRDRYYALFLEVNGIYGEHRSFLAAEFKQFEAEYTRLKMQYEQPNARKAELLPRLLHYLSWMIPALIDRKDYEKLEEHRIEMRSLDLDIWNTFQEKNLKEDKRRRH